MNNRELHQGQHLAALRPPGIIPGALLPRPRHPPRRRYELRLNDGPAPWSRSSASSMASVFGTDELAKTTLALFQAALTTRSYDTYGSCLRGFLLFCDEQGIDPLEVTPPEICRYVAWLGLRGSVAADSLQPYLSAINRFLQDHAVAPVALGPVVSSVRKGLAKSQFDLVPSDIRVPLPAPVALAILERGEHLVSRVAWTATDPSADLLLLRACVAVIIAYVFFNRGECGALTLTDDLLVNAEHITLLLRREKGKAGLRTPNVRQIDATLLADGRVAELLRAFDAGSALRGPFQRRWALTSAEDRAPWTAETIGDWLQLSFRSCGHSPPLGFAWLSHSLRKGAASAAHAIRVALTAIKFMGGWATNSNVLEAKYIDYAMRPSPAAMLFFGHLRRDDEGSLL